MSTYQCASTTMCSNGTRRKEVMQSYFSIGFSASDSIGKIQILEIQICSNHHLTSVHVTFNISLKENIILAAYHVLI